jgi:hypothetical protein
MSGVCFSEAPSVTNFVPGTVVAATTWHVWQAIGGGGSSRLRTLIV